jgi:hypothetical protein
VKPPDRPPPDAAPERRLPRLLRPHLVSHRGRSDGHLAARGVYGAVVVLALLLAMQGHPPGPWVSAITVAGSVLTVLAAELYAELLGLELDQGRASTREERRAKLHELGPITLSAEAPVLVLILAGIGLLELDRAFDIAIGLTIALITVDGFLARRLGGRTVLESLRSAALLGSLGLALALLKQLAH